MQALKFPAFPHHAPRLGAWGEDVFEGEKREKSGGEEEVARQALSSNHTCHQAS